LSSSEADQSTCVASCSHRVRNTHGAMQRASQSDHVLLSVRLQIEFSKSRTRTHTSNHKAPRFFYYRSKIILVQISYTHTEVHKEAPRSPLDAHRALPQPCHAPRLLVTRLQRLYVHLVVHCEYSSPDCSGSTSTTPRVRVPRHVAWLVATLAIDYFAHAARLGASAHRTAHRLSSTTSPTPRVRVPRHVARLVAWLVARLVVDYFAYASRPGASARRVAHLAARRRLLRVTRLVTWLVAPLIVDYSASRRLAVDYFASAARPGASACRGARLAARRVARCAAHRRLLRLAQARRRLLRLRRASGCLGTSRDSSRGSSRGSSSTTSPTPHVWVPRHVAWLVVWLVAPLVVDYFVYAARPGASARRAARHATHRRLLRVSRLRLAATLALLQPTVCRDYLSRGNTSSTSSMPCAATTSSSGRIASTIHLDLFSKLVENGSHAPNN
jgi:hypothetical protein